MDYANEIYISYFNGTDSIDDLCCAASYCASSARAHRRESSDATDIAEYDDEYQGEPGFWPLGL